MTPELRADLWDALLGPTGGLPGEAIEAIAPIIDAAIAVELHSLDADWTDAYARHPAVARAEAARCDALLAAADDLEAADFPDRVPEPGEIAHWLRARANQKPDVPRT